MQEIKTTLKNIVVKHSRREIMLDQVNEETNLSNDLGFDSIQIIEMIVDIETVFGITIEDEDLDLHTLFNFGLLEALIIKKTACLTAKA